MAPGYSASIDEGSQGQPEVRTPTFPPRQVLNQGGAYIVVDRPFSRLSGILSPTIIGTYLNARARSNAIG
jgi:hypothetical protein